MQAPAFNGRFEPPTIGGHPAGMVLGIGAIILAMPLIFLMPWWPIKSMFILIAITGVLVGWYYARLGNDVLFSGVMFAVARERRLYTHDFRGSD